MSARSFASVCVWNNQLYEQSGRTLPADSDLMINSLHPSKKLSQVRGKAEVQLAFIFQRWDFANAFHDFDGSDRTSPNGGWGIGKLLEEIIWDWRTSVPSFSLRQWTQAI